MSQFQLTGFSDEISPDFKEQLKYMTQFNIAFIEIRGVDGENIVSYSLDQVKAYKKQLDIAGIGISAIGSPIGKVSLKEDFQPHFDLFTHTVDIALLLNTQYIRLFSFYDVDLNSKDDEALVMERMKQMVTYAETKGITLLHENEKDIYGDSPDRCKALYEAMKSDHFKLILDPANYIQCGYEPYPSAYNLLKDYTVYYHIKDARAKDGAVLPAGLGDGRIGAMITDLKQANYQGFLSLEPHLGYFEGFSDLETETSQVDFVSKSGPDKFEIATAALRKLIEEAHNE